MLKPLAHITSISFSEVTPPSPQENVTTGYETEISREKNAHSGCTVYHRQPKLLVKSLGVWTRKKETKDTSFCYKLCSGACLKTIYKGGKFLKKLRCCVGGRV